MHNKVMSGTGTGFTEVYAQSLSADCDLDLCCDLDLWRSNMVLDCSMMIICAKLFPNSDMTNKVMSGTRTGFNEVYAQS